MSLESDGSITVYEIETGQLVAQYEGLEVHQAAERAKLIEKSLTDLLAIVWKLQIPIGLAVSAKLAIDTACDLVGKPETFTRKLWEECPRCYELPGWPCYCE